MDWAGEMAIEGGMSQSVTGLKSQEGGEGGGGGEKAKVLKSWVKALDLLTLHVLPRLGEWEAAGDFVRLQGVENGGWVPDERTEVRFCFSLSLHVRCVCAVLLISCVGIVARRRV